ncbi:hypothetical protein JTE90_013011 [Oedothorax gibbosus]|uniref:Cilia- and flagella-associated protein 126 n=1 Tax=Oedothorax gibbosus TaxID=931172 RepID=A0AAV6UMA7_9ARAC|nr:hypothetical protein JTE90_013011 [Oedothorax gibbosus]
MSQHFSAEQYESAYIPKHLSQWEVPKTFRKHPRLKDGFTTCLTDENGRFLLPRKHSALKEKSFEGTWGKDFTGPGAVPCSQIKPGVWIIKGNRARWVEGIRIDY